MDKLGKRAKDKVTGFEGIIIGKTSYLTGCDVYGLAGPATDGKVNDTNWFDEGRLEIIGDGVDPADLLVEKNGGMGMTTPNNRIR